MMPQKIDQRPLAVQIAVPVGEDGIWKIMRQLNESGAWKLTDVYGASNVHEATIRQYLRRLLAANIAVCEDEGSLVDGVPSAKTWRLCETPLDAPRFDKKGNPIGERTSNTIWRTAKMLGSFSAEQIATAASSDEQVFNPNTVARYLREWSRVGILFKLTKGNQKPVYRIKMQIGRLGPRILRCHAVYDPNSQTVIGELTSQEVAP